MVEVANGEKETSVSKEEKDRWMEVSKILRKMDCAAFWQASQPPTRIVMGETWLA